MTTVLPIDDVAEIAAMLAAGGVVALPTDTVYGVGALLSDDAAVAALFEMKLRPSGIALPILVGSLEQLIELDIEWSPRASSLARRFWPGPLTLVLTAPEWLARRVGSLTATVGVRLPDDEQLRQLLQVTGPLAVTSANTHGQPPCRDVDEVLGEFAGDSRLVAVADGGRRDGPISTVVDVTDDPWRVVREGAISAAQLANALT